MRKALLVFSLLLSLAAASANPPETTEALDIGFRLELFVDDYLIESMDRVELKLHSPEVQATALTFREPWEGLSSNAKPDPGERRETRVVRNASLTPRRPAFRQAA